MEDFLLDLPGLIVREGGETYLLVIFYMLCRTEGGNKFRASTAL